MLYLWPGSQSLQDYHPGFGVMSDPSRQAIVRGIKEGRWWAADNQRFARQSFKLDPFLRFLEQHRPYSARCMFAVVPDEPGNALETLQLYARFAPAIRSAGWPLAFVAQNGQEHLPLPGDPDWIFIGGWDLHDGSGDWKLGPGARAVIRQALAAGKRVHIGRVNSITRFQLFDELGADSCDGTYPTKEPTEAKRRLTRALESSTLPAWAGSALPAGDPIRQSPDRSPGVSNALDYGF